MICPYSPSPLLAPVMSVITWAWHFRSWAFRLLKSLAERSKRRNNWPNKFGAKPIHQLADLHSEAALYVIAVRDDAIEEVAKKMQAHLPAKALVAHTSGASPATILQPYFRHYGVFYPLQSFSRDKTVNWADTPLCVHARYKKDQEQLLHLAQQLSQQVALVDDRQRAQLHLAAVFVNNFTNYLYQIGAEITQAQDLPFDLLLPLIQQTVDKIKAQATPKTPAHLQTGPAIRGDQATLQRHLQQLQEQFPAYRNLYLQLSQGIQNMSDTTKTK